MMEEETKSTILITGGAGFIGSNLSVCFLVLNYNKRGMDCRI
jgi:nucleoside-diphosphate-sugar epimerase